MKPKTSINVSMSQVPERDAPLKPRTMEMPPLLKMVMARNRALKGEVTKESDLLLPAYKIYEGDVRYSETTEPNGFERFFQKEFATYTGKLLSDVRKVSLYTYFQCFQPFLAPVIAYFSIWWHSSWRNRPKINWNMIVCASPLRYLVENHYSYVLVCLNLNRNQAVKFMNSLNRFWRQFDSVERLEHGSMEQQGRSQNLQLVRRGQRLGSACRAAEEVEVSDNAGIVFIILSCWFLF